MHVLYCHQVITKTVTITNYTGHTVKNCTEYYKSLACPVMATIPKNS